MAHENSWEHSKIRKWLNNELYNTANPKLKETIKALSPHKSCYGKCDRCVWRNNGGCSEWNSSHGGVLISDRIFILTNSVPGKSH